MTDEQHIQKVKSGDQKSLAFLFEKYYFPLCRFANSFVSNTELAEEIVSDVFLNIWLNREKIEIRNNLKPYLFIAIKNQAFNLLKKNKFSFEYMDNTSEPYLQTTYSADVSVRYSETENEILAIINQLPSQRRAIFKLNRIEGLSYREIAEILSISVNTVQNQMVEAVKYISKYRSQFYQVCINGFTLLVGLAF